MMTTRELLETLTQEGYPLSQQSLSDLSKRGLIETPVRGRVKEGGRGSQGYWSPSTLKRLLEIARQRKAGRSYEEIEKELGKVTRPNATRLNLSIWLAPELAERLKRVSKTTGRPLVSLLQEGSRLYAEAPQTVKAVLERSSELVSLLDETNPAVQGTMAIFGYWAELAAAYHETVEAMKAKQSISQGSSETTRPGVVDRYLIKVAIKDGNLTIDDVQSQPDRVLEELLDDE